jgi:hypothetical protein
MARILETDIRCWARLGEFAFLDTATIHRLDYPRYTLRGCQRRLRLAKEGGFLRTAALAVCFDQQRLAGSAFVSRGGAVPVLHFITDRAADVVERTTGVRPKRVLRSEPAATTFLHGWEGVLHRLAFDDAASLAALAPAEWIMEQDPWPGAPEGLPPNQRRLLYHRFDALPSPVTCQPDALCKVVIPRGVADAEPTQLLCLWETDRSTEGLKQIQRKLRGYAEYLKAGAWTRYFPELTTVTVRIMWIAPSAERVENLCAVFRQSAVAPFCRFAVAADMTPEKILTAPIWRTVDGEPRAFLRR